MEWVRCSEKMPKLFELVLFATSKTTSPWFKFNANSGAGRCHLGFLLEDDDILLWHVEGSTFLERDNNISDDEIGFEMERYSIDYESAYFPLENVTHWMPLPETPNEMG